MTSYDTWIDRLIRQAQERGQFDNLPGQGKPLHLDDEAFVDPEWRLANRLLKNAGFAPDWIERDREIRLSLEAARSALLRTFRWREARLRDVESRHDLAAERERDVVAGEWRRAVDQFGEAIADVNRQIDLFNLKAPALHLQRKRLDAQAELARIERGREAASP
jgi:hypothetical protein